MGNITETAKWESDVYQIETSDRVLGGSEGIANRATKQIANRTAWLKQEVEKRAPLASPALTGTPTAPTPAQTVNNAQIATTAFVKTAIATLVGSAPAALDTLAELAQALGADANLKATLLATIGEKANIASPIFTGAPKAPTPAQTVNDTTLATTAYVKAAIAALVGSAPATLDTLAEIANALGADGNLKATLLAAISEKATQADFVTLKNLLIGIPMPYPLAAVPAGCLAFNGQAFNKSAYPILAQKYPSGILPDLRGEFIRGVDNSRGVDSGRALLSYQGDAMRVISGSIRTLQFIGASSGSGVFSVQAASRFGNYTSTESGGQGSFDVTFSNSGLVPTAGEFRPRNIAFQYICLAA